MEKPIDTQRIKRERCGGSTGDVSIVKQIIASHLISKKALKHLQNDEFYKFLEERNNTIKEEFKQIIGIRSEDKDGSLITPDTPFDNMQLYFSTIASSEDFMCILDPYYNLNALKLLNQGIKHNHSIKSVKILSRIHHITEDFKHNFKQLVKQLKNQKIKIELRVLLDPKDVSKIHDRYLITKNHSYNFVSADTMSRGQLSNIVEITDMQPYFDKLWIKGIDLLGNWNKIFIKNKQPTKSVDLVDFPDYIKKAYPDYKEHTHSAVMLTLLYENQYHEKDPIDSYALAKKMIERFPGLFEGKTIGKVSIGNIFSGTHLKKRGLINIGYKKYENSKDQYRVYWPII